MDSVSFAMIDEKARKAFFFFFFGTIFIFFSYFEKKKNKWRIGHRRFLNKMKNEGLGRLPVVCEPPLVWLATNP
jgi:hypothetical protein